MILHVLLGTILTVHCSQISDLDKTLYKLEQGLQNSAVNDYKIPYGKGIKDFVGIESPDCGKEIPLMNVTKMKKPNQIRLSSTGDSTEMGITWTTNHVNEVNVVRYGVLPDDLQYSTYSISHQYSWFDGYQSGFIHEALMINLQPGKIHYYQIESNNVKGPVTRFVASPGPGSDAPVSFFHVGDVGTFGTSVMVTDNMIENMKEKDYHGLIHCGDIAYANKYNGKRRSVMIDGKRFYTAKQEVWDTWAQMVEPIGSKVPYMVTPGNHEMDVYDSTNENTTIYHKRFSMPGNERYYSFGVGMVHFVSVSTDESINVNSTQHTWLDNKLAYLNKNRDKWPWVVTFQHRPIYNSNKNHGNWSGSNSYKPSGYTYPDLHGWPNAYDTLLTKHNVDLVLNGHVHHYERTWPIRNRTDTVQSYKNVEGRPIHITCGHGGKSLYRMVWGSRGENTYDAEVPTFSAARDNEHWGHCELEFVDRTTVKHKMYRMGERTPAEAVEITKQHPVSGTRVLRPILTFFLLSAVLSCC